MKPKNTELKVGIFAFVGIVILVIMIFRISDIKVGEGGYNVKVSFNFVNGVSVGAPVRLAGVQVGEIKSVQSFYDEKEGTSMALVTLYLRKYARVEEDAAITVNTLGLLGEKYIEIIPGSKGKRLLKDGDSLKGNDPASVEDLTVKGLEVVNKIENLVSSLGTIIEDKEIQDSVKGTLKNSKDLSDDLRLLTNELRDLTHTAQGILDKIDKGEGTVGRLISDDKIYRDLEEFIIDLKKHPWKLLQKGKEEKSREEKKQEDNRGFLFRR
jgi:phospholipid/cholesterol/gamma-HCH transport system substrate-binding protein